MVGRMKRPAKLVLRATLSMPYSMDQLLRAISEYDGPYGKVAEKYERWRRPFEPLVGVKSEAPNREAESSDSEDSDRKTVQRKKKEKKAKEKKSKERAPYQRLDYYPRNDILSKRSPSLIEGIQICESILTKS